MSSINIKGHPKEKKKGNANENSFYTSRNISDQFISNDKIISFLQQFLVRLYTFLIWDSLLYNDFLIHLDSNEYKLR